MTSYGSSASLNSSNSANVITSGPQDNPEAFEVLKQQKELWETGIEMWDKFIALHDRLSFKIGSYEVSSIIMEV